VERQDDSYQYRDSLGKILANIIPIFICGEEGLKAWWTPKSWKSAGSAIATFRSYVTRLINEERDDVNRGVQKNQHLVAALVRACASEEVEYAASTKSKKNMALTEEEIISNLFVYAFAGNDTTAIALTHLIVDLAAHPNAQDWIAQELRHYLPDENTSQWAYKTYPKLKRCQAVIVSTVNGCPWSTLTTMQMESLRINHPLGQLVKQTGEFSQPLKIGSRIIAIPPGTAIHLSLAAMHPHPQYWGEDSLKWNPSRFISTPTGQEWSFESEVLSPDTQEHFLPWATGQRVCPGKKFSQVELVATLAYIFRDYAVQPQPRAGESMDNARKRIYQTGMEIEHEGTVLHEIRHPETIALTWAKREK
jgi:cytochrome P450